MARIVCPFISGHAGKNIKNQPFASVIKRYFIEIKKEHFVPAYLLKHSFQNALLGNRFKR